MVTVEIYEDEEVCANCGHFSQHYAMVSAEYNRRGFMTVNAGYCLYPRVKDRRPGDTCDRFERRKGADL